MFTPSRCKDRGIRKFELVAKTQFLLKMYTPFQDYPGPMIDHDKASIENNKETYFNK